MPNSRQEFQPVILGIAGSVIFAYISRFIVEAGFSLFFFFFYFDFGACASLFVKSSIKKRQTNKTKSCIYGIEKKRYMYLFLRLKEIRGRHMANLH